jgi:hypothetical protein
MHTECVTILSLHPQNLFREHQFQNYPTPLIQASAFVYRNSDYEPIQSCSHMLHPLSILF